MSKEKQFMPAFDFLWAGPKAGLRQATRSIFLRLCFETLMEGRGDNFILPIAQNDAAAIMMICRGSLDENEIALAEMTEPGDPMIWIEPFKSRRLLTIVNWCEYYSKIVEIKNPGFRWSLADMRNMVIHRDRKMCRYCGEIPDEKAITIDHVIPKSQRGKDELSNLVTACANCNTRKGPRTPDQAGMVILPIGGG